MVAHCATSSNIGHFLLLDTFTKPILTNIYYFSMVSATDEYQKSQYRKGRQRKTSKKRTYNQIQDNAGPSRKNSRHRP